MTDAADPTRAGDRRPGLTPVIVISTSLFSLAIALFVAWFFLVRPHEANRTEIVDVDRFLAGSANGAADGADAHVELGAKVPDVEFERLGAAGTIRLGALAGKPVVLNFWASTCTPCLREMPLLEQLHREYGDRVSFVGVDAGESVEAGRAMVARTGVTYDQVRDAESEHVAHFGATALPNTVVIAADGTVTAIHPSAFTAAADLRQVIEAALAHRS